MKKPKRSTLIRKLDRIFSEYIRKRDTDYKGQVECISCQKTFQYKEVDAGHFISRKYLRTRWDEKNVHGQCRRCNRFAYGEQYLYSINLDRKLGDGTAEKLLMKSRQIIKLDSYDLEQLIEKFQNKLNNLCE
jgi:5-methylcytosine-specific restriction endonuclease McrA